MAEDTKTVKIFGPGCTTDMELSIIPGETVDQVIEVAVRDLTLPTNGRYTLLGPEGTALTGDVYKAVKDGSKLSIGRLDDGASTMRRQ